MDAFRGVERLLIVCGGIFFGYLGYCLFKHGVYNIKKSAFVGESKFFKLTFSGTAPGLFFMLFGSGILMTNLLVMHPRVTKTSYDVVSDRYGEADPRLGLESGDVVPNVSGANRYRRESWVSEPAGAEWRGEKEIYNATNDSWDEWTNEYSPTPK